MRLARYSWFLGLTVVSCLVFQQTEAQQRTPFDHITLPVVGSPRLIPGFDINTLPVGKVIGKPPLDERITTALDQPVEFTLKDASLDDFVDQIFEKYKINVVVDTLALTADGKGTEIKLTEKIRSVRLRSALKLILQPQGLTCVVENESLVITTNVAAETRTSTRIYQVQDLVVEPNDPANWPDFRSLKDLVTTTLTPEAWRDAGGTTASCQDFNGPGIMALIITHTEAGHAQVEELLAQLRAAKVPAIYELQQHRLRRGQDLELPLNVGGAATSPAGAIGS